MRIHLHIDRLRLDGVPVEQPHALRAALEAELKRKLAEGGLAAEFRAGTAVPRASGGAIGIERKSGAAQLGRQIAGAVYHGIGKPRGGGAA
ncbi:MAG TPA: hypothetical protein VLZ50_00850 [Terracidiphilus sp.]|nr:hypothetical protein [Terracidiphilus sp.]